MLRGTLTKNLVSACPIPSLCSLRLRMASASSASGEAHRRRELHSSDFDFDTHRDSHLKEIDRLSVAAAASTVDVHALDAAAPAIWDSFYARHEEKFFKPRYFVLEAFPELATAECILEIGVGNGSNVLPLLERSAVNRLLVCDIAPGALATVVAFGDRVVPFLWDIAVGSAPQRRPDMPDRTTTVPDAPDTGGAVGALGHDATTGLPVPGMGDLAASDLEGGAPRSRAASDSSCATVSRCALARTSAQALLPLLPGETQRLLRRTAAHGRAAAATIESAFSRWLVPPSEVRSSSVDAALLMFVLSALHPDRHASAIHNVAQVS